MVESNLIVRWTLLVIAKVVPFCFLITRKCLNIFLRPFYEKYRVITRLQIHGDRVSEGISFTFLQDGWHNTYTHLYGSKHVNIIHAIEICNPSSHPSCVEIVWCRNVLVPKRLLPMRGLLEGGFRVS